MGAMAAKREVSRGSVALPRLHKAIVGAEGQRHEPHRRGRRLAPALHQQRVNKRAMRVVRQEAGEQRRARQGDRLQRRAGGRAQQRVRQEAGRHKEARRLLRLHARGTDRSRGPAQGKGAPIQHTGCRQTGSR